MTDGNASSACRVGNNGSPGTVMKHVISAFLFLAVCAIAPAQAVQTPKAAESTATMARVRKIDVLIQILPLNLKKKQIDVILTQIEKAKEKERQIRILEDGDIAKLEPRVSNALKDGIEKGVYPSRELQVEVSKLTRAMSIRRSVALGEMVDDFYAGTKDILEAGQKTVMEKSLDVAALDPSVDAKKMDSEAKIRFFIKKIFLDESAYETLKEMAKFVQE